VSGNTEAHHGLFGDQDLGCDHLRYNSVPSGTWLPMLWKDRPHSLGQTTTRCRYLKVHQGRWWWPCRGRNK